MFSAVSKVFSIWFWWRQLATDQRPKFDSCRGD